MVKGSCLISGSYLIWVLLDLGLELDLVFLFDVGQTLMLKFDPLGTRRSRTCRFALYAPALPLPVRTTGACRAAAFHLDVRAGVALRALTFHLAVGAGGAVRAVFFHLAVRAGAAHRAALFHLAVGAGGAVRAVVFPRAVRARVALRAPTLRLAMRASLHSHRSPAKLPCAPRYALKHANECRSFFTLPRKAPRKTQNRLVGLRCHGNRHLDFNAALTENASSAITPTATSAAHAPPDTKRVFPSRHTGV